MFTIILLVIDFILFILSFVFIILDIKTYKESKNQQRIEKKFPKRSAYSLMFALLALILAVVISLGF